MILSTIINDLVWTPYGIQCPNEQVAHKVHKFLREAILDRHIYMHKIIGFAIKTNNTFRPYAGTYIARHKQIGESYPEVMVNMLDKVFLNATTDYLDTKLDTGMNTLLDHQFGDLKDVNCETLYTNPNICRCLMKETIFRVRIAYDCGYRSMADNSKELGSEYFPCYTDFSVANFFRVLPISPGDTLVPIRYYSGATEQNLKDLLLKWSIYIQTGSLKKGESLWVQSFEH